MFMKRLVNALKTAALLGMGLLCLIRTDLASRGVNVGVQRCLGVMIPSLYAMMIVSAMLVRSGIFSRRGNFLLFLFSQAAGYPVGTKMLMQRADSGEISPRQAALLSGVCFGAGPAFVFGCVAMRLFGSERAGLLILSSGIVSNTIIYAVLLPSLNSIPSQPLPPRKFTLSADDAMDCIVSAGKSMGVICLTVTAFSAAAEFLRYLGIFPLLADLLSAVTGRSPKVCEKLLSAAFDVTAAAELPSGDFTLLPAVSALVSFGGICVFAQLKAVCRGKLPVLPVIGIRTIAAVLSYILCRFALPFAMLSETAPAAAAHLHKSPSPVPSVMLMLMTAAVFRQRDLISGKKGGFQQ